MEKLLSTLMELPYPWQEFKIKLDGTFLEIDEELHYIWHTDVPQREINTCKPRKKAPTLLTRAKKINFWWLEPGVYFIYSIPFLVERKVEKIHKNSFTYEAYKITNLKNKKRKLIPNIFNFYKKEKHIIYTYKDSIYFLDKKIGIIKDSNIILNNSTFFPEVLDWNKDKKWTISLSEKL